MLASTDYANKVVRIEGHIKQTHQLDREVQAFLKKADSQQQQNKRMPKGGHSVNNFSNGQGRGGTLGKEQSGTYRKVQEGKPQRQSTAGNAGSRR